MHLPTVVRASATLALAACCAASSSEVEAAPRSLYLLTTDDRLALATESGNAAPTPLPIVGIVAGQSLVAIDVRPMSQRLYALGVDGAGAVQLYLVEPRAADALAVAIGASGSFVNGGGTPLPITGGAYGIDFNPAVDRLRVVNDAGFNFRMNPNTGALVDGDFGGAPGSVAGLNPDGPINTGAITADDAAYTNNRITTSITTLYTLNAAADALFIQNPPNAGTQTSAVPVTLAGTPLDFSASSGFDIAQGVDAAMSNGPATGSAYAALTVAGTAGLYRIDLANGAATLQRSFGALGVRDVAIAELEGTAIASSGTGTGLARFSLEAVGTSVGTGFSDVAAGETIVGIDLRPQNGTLIGLGINAAADTGTLYLVDPQSAACTAIGTAGAIAFVQADGVTPVDLPATEYGFDVNPAVDRVRVTSNAGALTFRLNPVTGAPVDGNGGVPGIQVDGIISGAPGISAAAYTNARASSLVGEATTLYTLDAAANQLDIQNPPNAGVQVAVAPVTANGAPLDFSSAAGFDIPRGVDVATSNAIANGHGYAALSVGGVASLYRIHLATGAAGLIGAVGTGATPVAGLVTFGPQREVLFADGFE